MITLGPRAERPNACSKNASADAVSRCSRSSTSTTWPCSSTARYKYHLSLAAEEEHLVGVPVVTERPTVFASFSRQLRPECLDPAQYGPVRHVDAPLGRSSITLLPEAGGAGTDARPSGSRRRANDSPRRPRRTGS